jgi:hypothetical protein
MHLVVQVALTLVVSALIMAPNMLLPSMLSPQVVFAQTAPDPQTETTAPAEQDSPNQAAAQPDDGEEFFGDSHRRRIYEQSQLSTTRATLYNLALPGLGNVYAEQYFYGGIAFSLMVFTLVFVGYGFSTEQPQFLWFGATTAAVAYTGSIATSIYGVHDYNEELRQGLKLDGAFAAGPWQLPRTRTLDLTIRF